MIRRIAAKAASLRPELKLFLAAIFCAGLAGGVGDTAFNNYLSDTFHISAATRGMLEFPRELPGFLTALGAGSLFFLSEPHLGAVAYLLFSAGLTGLAFADSNWPFMLAAMIIWSSGVHLSMPVTSSLTMSLAPEQRRGRRMGQVGALSGLGAIAGALIVWQLGRAGAVNYPAMFLSAAGAVALAAILIASLKTVGLHRPRPRLVLRRHFSLYYALELLFGARKQVFLTFGPWVLIKVFGEPPATFAKLRLLSSFLGILLVPLIGTAIDRFGERRILTADAFLLLLICLAYGFAERILPSRTLALRALYATYVLDQLLFACGMARATYVSKIARSPDEVAPTLSMGVTMNHAVSMSVPTLGGLLWAAFGYPSVFIFAAGIALATAAAASLIRIPPRGRPATASAE